MAPDSLRARMGVMAAAAGLALHCRAEPLAYQFRTGETNVYRIHLELTIEGGTVNYDGHVLLAPSGMDAESGRTVLALRGGLTAHFDSTGVPLPFRPPSFPQALNLPPYANLEADSAGRILAEAGDVALPLMAGRLGGALLVRLPSDDRSLLESVAEVSLPNDTPSPGMPWRPPYYEHSGFGGTAFASLNATRTTRVRVVSADPERAGLAWTWTLRSWLNFEKAPRLEGMGEGSATLDRGRGVLQEVRFSYRETTSSETVTRRQKLVFAADLLEGDERTAALNRQAPRTPRTLSVADVRAALEALTSPDEQRRNDAIEKLQSNEVEPLPADLASLAETLLETRDGTVRWIAARIVAAAATADQVPALLRLLKEPESPAREPAIAALRRLKDPRAIEPLVALVARGESESYTATEALKEFGPEAEEAVLGLFQEQHLATRRLACQILQEVGTSRSLERLREAMLDPDRQLRDLASQAVGPIVGRGR